MEMYTNFIFLVLIFKATCHEAKINGDIIVTYAGHAEAVDVPQIVVKPKNKTTTTSTTTEQAVTERTVADDVVFVPNNNENDRPYNYNAVRLEDLMNDKLRVSQTEAPKGDVLFVTGKNNDHEEIAPRKSERRNYQTHYDVGEKETKDEKLDCKHLNCNNTLNSVCGGKMERKRWRYRLFLNDCYFRKVNCAFSYDYNRYRKVSHDKCDNVGSHNSETSYMFRPSLEKPKKPNVQRRTFDSRRSLNRDVDGVGCDHACPVHCVNEYQPECAMSDSGQLKVFENHCKLDYHSCQKGMAWRVRPLSVCVGGKKADLQQNRAFIGWMQKVGIVDKKGKLVLS